nr:unnamed protein product [Spirometra erinaceieuropaei]
MFSATLMDANRDERPGIRIAYLTDGYLLNHGRMHFQSCVSTLIVHEPLFDDDCALNTISKEDMHRIMDLFPATCENFGLLINTEKTAVMRQLPPNTAPSPCAGKQREQNPNTSNVQVHVLGSTLSHSTIVDDEVARWMSKASQAFARL